MLMATTTQKKHGDDTLELHLERLLTERQKLVQKNADLQKLAEQQAAELRELKDKRTSSH